jgi:hypothetical protein
MDGQYPHLFVRCCNLLLEYHVHNRYIRGFADFAIPAPFSARVRNALNAEARSVRLSGLIGAGGFWYGFGRMLMRLYAETIILCLLQINHIFVQDWRHICIRFIRTLYQGMSYVYCM